MQRKILFGVIGVVVVLAIGATVLYLLASRTSSASADDALVEFRATAGEGRGDLPGLPPQGVYRYSVEGSESIGGGPLSVTRDLPETSPRILRHTDDGYETEWRISSDHTEYWRYVLDDRGASTAEERSKLTVAGISGTTENEWSPPPLRLPLDPEIGDRWTSEAATPDGQTVRIESVVAGEDTIDVGGTPVTVTNVESTLEFGGDLTGEIRETNSYDATTGMEVRHVSESTLTEGGSTVTTRWDATLESLEPAQ